MPIHDFTDDDRKHRGFRPLQESLEKHLQKLREKNDKPASDVDTAELRGRISAIKDLLKDMQDKVPKEPRSVLPPYL